MLEFRHFDSAKKLAMEDIRVLIHDLKLWQCEGLEICSGHLRTLWREPNLGNYIA